MIYCDESGNCKYFGVAYYFLSNNFCSSYYHVHVDILHCYDYNRCCLNIHFFVSRISIILRDHRRTCFNGIYRDIQGLMVLYLPSIYVKPVVRIINASRVCVLWMCRIIFVVLTNVFFGWVFILFLDPVLGPE